jgi:molybdopterin/thiamine biosynthesis adenylyltransferase
MLKRYAKNTPLFSESDIERIHQIRVCVIGCGGVGTQIIEALARFGVNQITAVDKDVIDESDLNRLIHSNTKTIGLPKASVMKKFLDNINDRININTLTMTYTDTLGPKIIKNHDVVIDATGDLDIKRLLATHCSQANIPMLYTYYSDFTGYIAWILPNSNDLEHLLPLVPKRTEKSSKPIFTSSITGNIAVYELFKQQLQDKDRLQHELLTFNIQEFSSTRTLLNK